jgi:hypothetical protein
MCENTASKNTDFMRLSHEFGQRSRILRLANHPILCRIRLFAPQPACIWEKWSCPSFGYLFLFALTFLALSCTSRPLEYEDATITISRDGNCFSCPWYTTTIYSDGTIVYRGVAGVRAKGSRVGHIPEDSVRQLVREMLAIHYFTLHHQYDTPKFSEAETVTTSLILGSRKNEVVDEAGAPDSLGLIEKRIDQMVGTAIWVGKGERPPSEAIHHLLNVRKDIDSLESIDDEMLQRYQNLRDAGDVRSAYHLFYEERKLNDRIRGAYAEFDSVGINSIGIKSTGIIPVQVPDTTK